jgi:hypothetical protein
VPPHRQTNPVRRGCDAKFAQATCTIILRAPHRRRFCGSLCATCSPPGRNAAVIKRTLRYPRSTAKSPMTRLRSRRPPGARRTEPKPTAGTQEPGVGSTWRRRRGC